LLPEPGLDNLTGIDAALGQRRKMPKGGPLALGRQYQNLWQLPIPFRKLSRQTGHVSLPEYTSQFARQAEQYVCPQLVSTAPVGKLKQMAHVPEIVSTLYSNTIRLLKGDA
jgi:hypothetical protein